MKRFILFLGIILHLTGFACSPFIAFSRSEPSPAEPVIVVTEEIVISEPTALPIPTETPVPLPAFTATTYRDEEAGFEFDYPADWAFDSGEQHSRGYFVQFYSWEWQPGDQIDSLSEGETMLSVTVQRWDPKNDLDAFVDQRKMAWDSSGSSILSEGRLILAGNRPAAQFIIQGVDGAQAFFLLTTNEDDYLVLSGNGDLSLLAEIVHTVRPIQ